MIDNITFPLSIENWQLDYWADRLFIPEYCLQVVKCARLQNSIIKTKMIGQIFQNIIDVSSY